MPCAQKIVNNQNDDEDAKCSACKTNYEIKID
jgi:hypothetical protein